MLEVRTNVSEIEELIKNLAEASGKIFMMMRYNVELLFLTAVSTSTFREVCHFDNRRVCFGWSSR